VKGSGRVGALSVLDEAGYAVRRVAGTSAGAIVGALTMAGMPVAQMHQLMSQLDYRRFRDEGWLARLGLVGKAASLLFERGVYEGDFLRTWLDEQLGRLGVATFGDLRLTEPWAEVLPPEQRYKLVVIVSDVTRGRLVRLPWDYHVYGLDPNEQRVADAVRASTSTPFFYEPTHMDGSLLVDGGILSNFPIDLFDNTALWPTFGIKLSAKPEANLVAVPARNSFEFGAAILHTMADAHDQMHLDDPCTLRRTIFVDTMTLKATDFDITRQQQEQLHANGRHGAEKFLETWDFAKYWAECGVELEHRHKPRGLNP
jgi:NTE family protein